MTKLPAPPAPPALIDDEHVLPEIARESVAHGLTHGKPGDPNMAQYGGLLIQPGASFVTLKLDGELRGCVGSVEPRRPLVRDVAENAFAAGFQDSRFGPLSADELDRLTLGVSILGPLTPIDASSDAELIEQLVPGADGLVLRDRERRGLFLPQVWEILTSPRDFITHLKAKAGIPSGPWPPTLKAQKFHVRSVGDPDV